LEEEPYLVFQKRRKLIEELLFLLGVEGLFLGVQN
jgi:hypothetical protein